MTFWKNQLNNIETELKYYDVKNFDKKIKKEKIDLKISDEIYFNSIIALYLSRINNVNTTVLKSNDKLFIYKYDKNTTFNEFIEKNKKINKEFNKHSHNEINDIIFKNLLFNYSIMEDDPLEETILTINIKNNEISINYNINVFSDTFINHMIKNLKFLINEAISKPNTLCINIDIISDEEKSLLKKYCKGEKIESKYNMLATQIEINSKKIPDVVGLDDGEKLTYKEINKLINKFAYGLKHKYHINHGDIVSILLPRGNLYLITVISLFKIGAAVIPHDLFYPLDYHKDMIENFDVKAVIQKKELNLNLKSIYIDDLLNLEDNGSIKDESNNKDLALIMFTSGTTGKPKGIKITHNHLMNFIMNVTPIFPFNYGEISIAFASFSHTFSFAAYYVLYYGGCNKIIIENNKKSIPKLVKYLLTHKIKNCGLSPDFGLYLYNQYDLDLDTLMLTGSKISIKKPIPKKKTRLLNLYGATETSGFTVCYEINPEIPMNDVPVGNSIPNNYAYIIDSNNQQMPLGVTGEIVLGGKGVSDGYLNDEKNTALKFKENPFKDNEYNKIIYYTGDLAYFDFEGKIHIKGRKDSQLNPNGLRIEPNHITSKVEKYPNITQSYIKLVNNNLTLYYIANEKIDENLLKKYLKEKLPEYMIPKFFIQLKEFPMNILGKIDINKLPKPNLKTEEISEITETEKSILDMAFKLIDNDNFNITTNLYSVGFTSLTLMELNHQIFIKYQQEIKLPEKPTIKEIAKQINLNNKHKIKKYPKQNYYPLSDVQLKNFNLSNNLKLYNIPIIIKLDKSWNVNKLKEAIINTINAHPYLKMTIIEKDKNYYQKRNDNLDISNQIEIKEFDKIEHESFNLLNSNLFKFTIYKTEQNIILFAQFHHILIDGTSINLFFKDVLNSYNNKKLNKEIMDGFDYALYQNEKKETIEYKNAKEYYDKKLKKKKYSTFLPSTIKIISKRKEKQIEVKINKEDILNYCNKTKINTNILFLSCTILNLNNYIENPIIFSTYNGRENPIFFNTQAKLNRTFPLICDELNTKESFEKFSNEVKQLWLESINNSIYPYIKIKEEYGLNEYIKFIYHEDIIDLKENITQPTINQDEDNDDSHIYRIKIEIFERNQEFLISIKYNSLLYPNNFMEEIINNLKITINKVISKEI